MKIAIPVWGYYVSTVFDFSDRLLIVDVDSGRIKDRSTVHFVENTIVGKAARLRELGVQVLLCGAISRPLERMIAVSGMTVVPFLRGTADEILEAYLSGRLRDRSFVLPGCRLYGEPPGGRGMRHRGRRGDRGNIKKGF